MVGVTDDGEVTPEPSATLWGDVHSDVQVRTAEGLRTWRLDPLFDDQELDSRPIGPVYWEGAVRGDGARGYLELTGYEAPLAL